MADTGTPPTIPIEFQQYNSYVEDPKWQRKFSAIWASFVGAAILCALPHLVRSIKQRRALTGLSGIWENFSRKRYEAIAYEGKTVYRSPDGNRRLAAILRSVGAILLWTPPGIELNAGQIVLIICYIAVVLVCIAVNAPLISNPNRAGFLALAQLPVVFLFATKNSVLSLLLGPGNGYEKLNYIHRWAGRGLFLAGAIHGSLWIRNHVQYDLPILGQQKETSGVAAFALLCVIVLSSLRPVRRYFYQIFWIIHILTFVAFFITICYHTIYAPPWIFPPLAFYGLDILMRMFRYRIKDAIITHVDQQMTIIRVADCDGGWQAGQHVRLRVFFSGRVFESHPLTILSAPSASSCISSQALFLAARVCGDWTRALNVYAKEGADFFSKEGKEARENLGTQVQVMIDGPYGGCSVDLGRYESVLLVSGGSGATFAIGLLDDIVGRCVKLGRRGGERTKRIEFAWCTRSFGSIDWFSPQLMDIANAAAGSSIDLHLSIFVTCLCNPENVPPIPNLDVTIHRPSVTTILQDLLFPPSTEGSEEGITTRPEKDSMSPKTWVPTGGGVAVCASGPETMTREAQNAVARMAMTRGIELGGIALHTELFSM